MRNYRKEYDNYQGKPKQKKNRANRNKARRILTKAKRVKKGDGKDVHHVDGNPKNSSRSNLKVTSKTKNRSFPRNKDATKKRYVLVNKVFLLPVNQKKASLLNKKPDVNLLKLDTVKI